MAEAVKKHNYDDPTAMIRELIIDEHDAILGYKDMIDRIMGEENPDVRIVKVFTDIMNEEKVHIGELQALLEILDPDVKAFDTAGRNEVYGMMQPGGSDDKLGGDD